MEDNADIELIQCADHRYPPSLATISRPPRELYIKGGFSSLPCVAIVGTRKATTYGKTLAHDWAMALSRQGYAIVSGLAFGIDAAAHQGALESAGVTYAVLAHGLDTVSPTSHRLLAQSIISSGGALLSEYPPTTPALGYHFIERNRIISGLSKAVIIIEAPLHSGALATASFAVDQRIPLFVAPGPTTISTFSGSHELIRNGARLVTSVSDILFDLEQKRQVKIDQSSLPQLTQSNNPVMEELLKAAIPCSVDKLVQLTKLSPQEIQSQLTLLLIDDVIIEEGGMYCVKQSPSGKKNI